MNLGNAVGIFLIGGGFLLVAMGFLPAMLSGQTLIYPDIPATIKIGLVFVITGVIISFMSLTVERMLINERREREREEKEALEKKHNKG
ncbi:MAG: hypothetical protein L6243_04160 [Candidatus Altiarchaeales archaeon]|nr:hypothetical protein [Candidatus Altiarchaeota archaeon]MCG2782763.1 hypothetical protein [Candidatus Altiarchaeales archaeon]MBU4265615.1 hypothetical protein [Candidatus Altiarchaeota archaeon]MBU4342321.1 hypothetical protein [Candidatus Altiarchaeota archaeon]MBU4407011.1 hypothetical protein [Candidatus Altiarchaeota archaeon]